MKRIILAFGCLLQIAYAQIYSNDITGTSPSTSNPYTTGQVTNANLAGIGIGRGAGINSNAGNDRYNTNAFVTASPSLANAISNNEFINIRFSPNTGYTVNLNGADFVFTTQNSGTGPANYAVFISSDGFTAGDELVTYSGAATRTYTFPASGYNNLTGTIEIRIYAWGATAAGGTFSINDFVVNGSLVSSCTPPVGTPAGITNQSRCGTGNMTFTATDPSPLTVQWSQASDFSTIAATGLSYTTSYSTTTTVYARLFDSGTSCAATTSTSNTATVHNNTTALTPSPSATPNFCGSGTISVTGGSGTIYYQGTTSNGTSTATAASSQLISSSGTYYFRAQDANGCWGPQQAFTVSVGTEPTTQATHITSTYLSGLGTVIMAAGNGDRRLVLIKEGSAVDADPVDGTTYTAPNTFEFGLGSEIGTGNYVMHAGAATTAFVTRLKCGTTYHVKVYEYNDAAKCYLQSTLANTGSFTTPATAPTAGSISGFASVTETGMSVNITRSSGAGYVLVAKQGSAVNLAPPNGLNPALIPGVSTDFSAATDQGSGNKILAVGTGASVSISGMVCGSSYHFAVYEYDGTNFCFSPAATGSRASTSCPLSGNLVVNEAFNDGGVEWVELLAVGTPGTTVDLRGYIIDDNNGDFSGGPAAGDGIASGHIRFANTCEWEAIPVGAIILIYNEANSTPGGLTDDLYDSDADYTYVLPADAATLQSNSNAAPDFTTASYTPYTAVAGTWGDISVTDGDAFQVRLPSPAFTYVHGISFERTAGSTNISDANHPDYGTYNTNCLYWETGSGNDITVRMMNVVDNDFKKKSNWTGQFATTLTEGTPGAPNGGNNTSYINNLRQPFTVVTTAQNHTCTWRANQEKIWVDGGGSAQQIFCRLKNNTGVNRGSTTVRSLVEAGAFTRDYAGQTYYMLPKHIQVEPTTTTAGTYDITLYITPAELSALTAHINTEKSASYTDAEIRALLQVVHVFGTTNSVASTGLTIAQFELAENPTIGTYGAATTLTSSFTTFSDYGIGVPDDKLLPIELTVFEATKESNARVRLQWQTATEINNDYFVIERSTDGKAFASIGAVPGAGTTYSPQAYSLLDSELPGGAQQLYYRLKQVDYDGSVHDKGVRVVTLDNSATDLKHTISAYPNPTKGSIRLACQGNCTDASFSLRILNNLGQQVAADWTGGVEQLNAKLVENFGTLPSGIYSLQLRQDATLQTIRVIKH
jgi:hypothetical protein